MSFGYQVLGFGSGGGAAPYTIECLVVAGGGSSQNNNGGGGGGGGMRTSTTIELSPGTAYTTTVGAGAASALTPGSAPGDGIASEITGTDITSFTAAGAGRGSGLNQAGSDGGSGGGGGGGNPGRLGGEGNTPATVPSQGADGGTGATGPAPFNNCGGGGGGGGGGEGQIGTTGAGNAGGEGGDGTVSQIVGTPTYYGGGGGGEGYPGGAQAPGGQGGGGQGATFPINPAGQNGGVNTGGGSGGGPSTGGGSGFVVLKIPDANYSGTTTGSPTVDTGTSPGFTIVKYTGTGSYTG